MTIANNFLSSIDNDEEHVMHSKGRNIEIIMNHKTDETIEETFDTLNYGNQNNLEFLKVVIDHLLHYKCHKIIPNCGRSYIDSPDWIKNKKATVNPINKKDTKS